MLTWCNPDLSYLRSEEHTSELQSHNAISYAVFCLSKMISKPQRLHSKSWVSAHSIPSSLAPLIPWALPSPIYQTPLHVTISFAALSHHSPHKTMSYSSALTDNILLTIQTSSHLCIPHLPYYTQKYRKLRSGLHQVSTPAPPPFQTS